MSNDIEHDEVEGFLGVYAIHAVEPAEAERIEEHLRVCPRCRAEVDAHYGTAAAIGNSVEPVPLELWDRIADRLSEQYESDPPADVDVPAWLESVTSTPRLAERFADPAPVINLARERQRRRVLSRRVMATITAAAAVAVGILAVNVSQNDNTVSQLQSALAAKGDSAAIETALADPHHQLVRMRSPNGAQLAEFIVVPGGHGYLTASTMLGLPSDETYQLWAMIDGQFISLGLLGSHPKSAAFTESGSSPSQLAITIEPAGGVITPNRSPVATGKISLS